MPKLYRKTVFATFDTYTEALLDEYQPDDFVYLTVERNQELFEDVETVVWRDEVPEKDEYSAGCPGGMGIFLQKFFDLKDPDA